MDILNLQTTIVYHYLEQSTKRIIVLQGGTRSGKTQNTMMWFIVRMLRENNKILTVVRDSLPSLKGSVIRDFVDIMLRLGIYSEDCHNKTENTYTLGTNLIEFVSCDQPHKIRGRKRNYLFANEATELSYDSWLQLVFRTEERIVIDYNPSEIDSYIYDHILPRNDVDFFITTYLDNPFLSPDLVAEIERLKDADPDYWRIYGEGQRGSGREIIFTHYKIVNELPIGDYFYGCDLGFNHKTALIKCVDCDGEIFAKETVYQSRLTTTDLSGIMKGLQIDTYVPIYFDYADPRSAEQLSRDGFNMIPCAAKNVRESIMAVKSKPLSITSDSVNLIKELKNYSWKKDKTGMILDEPVKYMDDAIDALRYAVSTRIANPVRTIHAF